MKKTKKTKKTISVEDGIEGILRCDIICDMSHRDTANAMWDRVSNQVRIQFIPLIREEMIINDNIKY